MGVEYMESLDDKVYLFGDLNIPEVCWKKSNIEGYTTHKSTKQDLINALISMGDRKQIVNFPTRDKNILDVIIIPANSDAECGPTISPEKTNERAGTDHEWIWCRVNS